MSIYDLSPTGLTLNIYPPRSLALDKSSTDKFSNDLGSSALNKLFPDKFGEEQDYPLMGKSSPDDYFLSDELSPDGRDCVP